MPSSSCRCDSPTHSSKQRMPKKLRKKRLKGLCFLSSLKVCCTSDGSSDSSESCSLVCLWGNSTDLSLLINMTEDQIKSLQSTGGDHLAATEKNILGNHLSSLWDSVKNLRAKTGGRIDFVLDNAGFELYCDCVYGGPHICDHPKPTFSCILQPTSLSKVASRTRSASTESDLRGSYRM